MKYTKEVLETAAKESRSIRQTVEKAGGNSNSGGVYQHVKRKLKEFGIDTSHFTGRAYLRGGTSSNYKPPSERLILRTKGARTQAHVLRRSLDDLKRERVCGECGLKENWNNKPLVLEIDHINGNCLDDRAENLQYLCPNCHSQK